MTLNSGRYIRFEAYTKPGQKTLTIMVRSKDRDEFLGNIRWFGRWRCYAFAPDGDAIFEKVCLRELAQACEDLTIAHKKKEKILCA